MRAVITRTTGATLTIDGQEHARIGQGLLVLLGITQSDTPKQATYLAENAPACGSLKTKTAS